MSKLKAADEKAQTEAGTTGSLPVPMGLAPPFNPDEYTSDDESKLIAWLNGVDGKSLPKHMTVDYGLKVHPQPYAEKIHFFGGPENVPPKLAAEWKKQGVTIREQTDEEVKNGFVKDELLKLFGSIHLIGSNVSKEGLTELGLRVEQSGTSFFLRNVDQPKLNKKK